MKDEVLPSIMDAHLKNMKKSSFGVRFDPYAGLATCGIAGIGTDKDKKEEEGKSRRPGSIASLVQRFQLIQMNDKTLRWKTLDFCNEK